MTAIPTTSSAIPATMAVSPDHLWRRILASGRVLIGGGVLVVVLLLCVATLPWALRKQSPAYYDHQAQFDARQPPSGASIAQWFGTDKLGRSLLGRSLLGGSISLFVGIMAAVISVLLGVSVGLVAGYCGGWIDAVLMRFVDVLYGLPYILMVILFRIALVEPIRKLIVHISPQDKYGNPWLDPTRTASLVVLFLAIGLVSWLTMARVVRGQVLALRNQPFIEAARASGLTNWRIFFRHLLPNLAGPIIIYSTLTIPQAILQESFLSFLGIGVAAPVPSWGSLASDGLLPALNTINSNWWLLLFPCTLLALTLLCLNFVGDGLRDVFDPKREAAKI